MLICVRRGRAVPGPAAAEIERYELPGVGVEGFDDMSSAVHGWGDSEAHECEIRVLDRRAVYGRQRAELLGDSLDFHQKRIAHQLLRIDGGRLAPGVGRCGPFTAVGTAKQPRQWSADDRVDRGHNAGDDFRGLSTVTAHENAAAGRLRTESLDDLLRRLDTSREGLRSREAAQRLTAFGPNQLRTSRFHTELIETIQAAANPLVVILLVAGAASAFLGEATEAAIIGGIVVMSSGINVWQTFPVTARRFEIARTDCSHRHGTTRRRLDQRFPGATSWSVMSFVSHLVTSFLPTLA